MSNKIVWGRIPMSPYNSITCLKILAHFKGPISSLQSIGKCTAFYMCAAWSVGLTNSSEVTRKLVNMLLKSCTQSVGWQYFLHVKST